MSIDPAVVLFKDVYQTTDGSIEAALLELKRKGWTRLQTVAVLVAVFEVQVAYAEEVVAESLAWS